MKQETLEPLTQGNPVVKEGKQQPETNSYFDNFEQERERIRRQVLSSVSHDLKTPLAAIIGSLEIHERIKGTISEEKKTQLITTALMEAYRLDNFISNILDMAKLEGGMVKARKEIFRIENLISDCVEKSSQRLHKRKIKVEGEKFNINTDALLFCRIIGLLIDNAIKYSNPASEIIVRSSRSGKDTICVQVIDGGPGIPEDKLEEIFSKYARIQRGDHQSAGTGLGLAISKAIALVLDGHLYAENRKEGGTILTLELFHSRA